MKDENIEVSKDELRESFHIQRRIFESEERFLFKEHLLLAVKRVLDVRDLRNIAQKEHSKSLKEEIEKQYLNSVKDLMNIVYSIFNDYPFCSLFENEIDKEDYIVLNMEDMVLVNGVIHELKPYNSDNINIDTIFIALDESLFHYINDIENDVNYADGFDENDFVEICEEEQEDYDE